MAETLFCHPALHDILSVLTFTSGRRCVQPALGEELLQEFSDIQRWLRLRFLCQEKKTETEDQISLVEERLEVPGCVFPYSKYNNMLNVA